MDGYGQDLEPRIWQVALTAGGDPTYAVYNKDITNLLIFLIIWLNVLVFLSCTEAVNLQ